MTKSDSKHDKQRLEAPEGKPLLADGLRRGSRARRRYLYEIEFFDAGHAPTPAHPTGGGIARPQERLATDLLFGPHELDEGPRDPRLKRMIQAAASGWVAGKI